MENEIYRARVESDSDDDKVIHVTLTKELNCHLIWLYYEEYGPLIIWVGRSPETGSKSTYDAIDKAVWLGQQSFDDLMSMTVDKGLVVYENY